MSSITVQPCRLISIQKIVVGTEDSNCFGIRRQVENSSWVLGQVFWFVTFWNYHLGTEDPWYGTWVTYWSCYQREGFCSGGFYVHMLFHSELLRMLSHSLSPLSSTSVIFLLGGSLWPSLQLLRCCHSWLAKGWSISETQQRIHTVSGSSS
jgi:hypothetical protein